MEQMYMQYNGAPYADPATLQLLADMEKSQKKRRNPWDELMQEERDEDAMLQNQWDLAAIWGG